jgi:hypothetical protein
MNEILSPEKREARKLISGFAGILFTLSVGFGPPDRLDGFSPGSNLKGTLFSSCLRFNLTSTFTYLSGFPYAQLLVLRTG